MSEKYIVSNIFGTFIFDEKFQLVEKIDVNIENSSEWNDAEKSLVDKYQDKLFYIGSKKSKLDGIKLSNDPKKLKIISEYFKHNFKDFYSLNLDLTKKKVKASVQDDSLIIQTIRNIEELNKITNNMAKRLREWYELYLPEFSKNCDDHEVFVSRILKDDKTVLLKEIKLSKEKTMGQDLNDNDVKAILNLAKKIDSLYKLRDEQEKYLEDKMKLFCPNLLAIAGATIGANLISHAGDMKRLMLMPASTVQLLGAEKALFRHIKTGAKPPKYGVLLNHSLVAKAKEKGKAARKLADKITIAIKVDYYKGEFIGDKLRKQVEDQVC